ncbi:adenylyltransferase/cytidyltransferase family protein [Candidatus Woesearchaeota archaeon]|nr:adenylyltransferase/cytidyltransferase family protein [Candidatus Woesearchaeota archaeon]
MGIVTTLEKLKEIAQQLRKQGKKIVTCNGCFDLLHRGHVYFLQEAKKQGDVLIVGMNTDGVVRASKGDGRPVYAQEDRAAIVAALGCVDYVVIIDGKEIATPLVEAIKPDVHVNGSEYGEHCVEAEAVRKNGGRLYIVQRDPKHATTTTLKKIERR